MYFGPPARCIVLAGACVAPTRIPVHVKVQKQRAASMTRKSAAASKPPKPTKPKRPKPAASRQSTREPTPDEEFYAIRDILDERRIDGILQYHVDWADNPTTGERYDPTWVCYKHLPPTLPTYLSILHFYRSLHPHMRPHSANHNIHSPPPPGTGSQRHHRRSRRLGKGEAPTAGR